MPAPGAAEQPQAGFQPRTRSECKPPAGSLTLRSQRTRSEVGAPSPPPSFLPRPTAGHPSHPWDTLRVWQLGRLQLLENMAGFTSTAKHPVTFLRLECNLFLEALLENLNLVSHQLFIIREAYV